MMKFTAALLFISTATALPASSADSCCDKDVKSFEHHEEIVANYLKIWNGEDYSLMDKVFSEDVYIHFDRFPTGADEDSDEEGSVPMEFNDRDEFLEFIKESREGWDEYSFTLYNHAAHGLEGAFRWGLKAVIGEDFDMVPTPLKRGDATYNNGTDYTILNECTGLVDKAYVGQDLITFFNGLKAGSVTV